MKKFLIAITAATLLSPVLASAQKVKLQDGNINVLKGVKQLNVQFVYDGTTVGKKSEQDFLADKKADYNKKEPGKGDTWEKSWKADRKARFEPRFEEEFQKQSDIVAGDFPSEKYTLIFKTITTEPGFNIGVMKKNAMIDGEATLVETANPSHVIAKFSVDNCPGRTFTGNNYNTGERLQEAYAVAGKGLGKYLRKEL